MLPGVPIESDDSLELEMLGSAMKAAVDAEQKFAVLGQKVTAIRIWKGRLIATGSNRSAYVYLLPCRRCRQSSGV